MAYLHRFFQDRAAADPEREALAAGDLRWTCGELAARARRLAATLRSLGIGPEVPVGICTRRTPEMVAGMLGVLEAGGAYLPLDPKYPRERLRFMLEDAGAPVVLTDAGSAGALPETRARRLFLDRPDGWDGDAEARSVEPAPGSLAYLIYTSGSTGRPKGVAIPHQAAAHLMLWARDLFPPEELAGVLASTSICFDLSVFEIFVPLSWGGRVILADNALALPTLPAAGEVTLVNTVPSAAAELVRTGGFPSSVRTINLAGEALQRALVDQLYGKTSARAVFNLYGPSEDTTYSTWARVPRDGTSAPTIGVPLPDESARVLGPDRMPVPGGEEGEPGELYLGGPALARGYLGRPDLTAERFLPDPYSPEPGARMYRTGDLVRLRPDGELDFLGRIDHQVKIRGFRIELGEIEAALLAVPGVKECVVVAHRETPADTGPRLVAYAAPVDVPVSELRRALAARLPEHMVPSAFVLLPALPLTPNGKVDRKALPAPDRARPEVGPYVAPRDEVEERLAGLWAEALGLDAVGVEDDFFELGGHSLVAGRLFSRLRRSFGADCSLRDLFAARTVAAFAALLREAAGPARSLAGAAGAGEPPLSFGHERLLFLQRLEAEPVTYSVPISGTLSGPLDVEALKRAFTELARRHEPLRTVFASKDGREVQVVLPAEEIPLPVHDLTGMPEAADRLAWEEFRRPLDLERGPVIRATLLRLGGQGNREHRLLLTVHHIAWDDGSMAVLLRELPALYRGESLPPLPARYADFAAWQRARFQGAELEERLDRWAGRFRDLPQPVELPTDRPRPARVSPRGGERLFEVPDGPARALRALARREGATLFMASMALLKALVHRLTGQEDLSILAPVSTRTRVELEPLVGFFVNNLFVRTGLGGDPTFADLAGRVREATLAAFEHQELPLDLALRRIHPGNPAAIQSLLRVIFALFPEIPGVELAPGLAMTLREVGNGTAKADLTLFLEDRADGRMGVRIEYAADLFDAPTVQRMEGFLLALLEGVAADPDRRLSGLPFLSEAQRSQLLVDWNDTGISYPRDACIHELFEEHVRRAPDALALRFTHGGTTGEMTYAELDARADALAGVLVAEGVGPDRLVGLCLERSPEAIVAILAILKAGGAFAPLDPAYPEDRLAFMLEDTAAPVLITRRGLLGRLPETAAKVICWEDLSPHPPAPSPGTGEGETCTFPDNLAYVMYTSGSTGRPKGVAVTHRDVVRLARSSRFADFGSDHVFLHLGPLSFDATTLEVGYSLLNGSALAILPPETPSLEELGGFLVRQGVTAAWLTAGLFHQMVESQLPSLAGLRLILSGGDVLSPSHVARVLEAAPGITVVNGYGPTESTVFTSCHPMRSPGEVESPLPIGRPIGNTRVAVVDQGFQLAPPGVEGELWIGGDGLARGYLHRPDLTAERFVPDPFWKTGERLYRTGDLVRWRPDGLLEFLGRVDHQVKLRGFRVELGEIEAALASHPEVAEAAVVVQGEGGDKRLVAFWMGQTEPDLRAFLSGRLPAHMVPAAFVRLDALPLNPHGKVDRKALSRIEPVRERTGTGLEAPGSATEELLAGIWAELLGLDRIGVRESFFELGGHSLLILRMLSRVREILGADLVPRDVFDAPTIAELAERIASRRIGKLPPVLPVSREGDLPLSYAQHRLWFLERLGTLPGTYNVPVAFRIRGELDARALQTAMTELVRRHEALRTAFPMRDGEPVQSIAAPSPVPMPLIDLSGIDGREREAQRLGREEASSPFDLETGPLLRARLIRLAPDDHLWLVNLHHIVTDGWSHEVFAREIPQLYSASPLPELPVQYADYSVWQRQWLESGVLAEQLAWWRRTLEGLETLELPVDRPRPPVQTWRGANRTRRLPVELAEALGSLGRSRGATRFMTLLAVTAALLERHVGGHGRRDFAIGTPVTNRNRPEIEALIGFFVNTLVLRVGFDAGFRKTGSFADLLARVRESTLSAYAHPDLPFERLVEEMRPERQLNHSPLFQVVFSYLGGAGGGLELPGLAVSESAVETGTAKFDLTVGIIDRPGELALDVEYNTDLFEAATIDRMALGFERLLAEAVARSGDPLDSLEILGEAERRQLLAWSRGEEVDAAATIHGLFEARAARRPEATALRFPGGEMTYADLDARAEALAAVLRREGVGPDGLVALCLERSAEAVVAMVAILKAGGAFVPLDPAYPAERLELLLADSAAPVLITRRGLLERLPAGTTRILCREDLPSLPSSPSFGSVVLPDNLAYVMYTSGSTGRPKGVAATHRNVVRLVRDSSFMRFGPDEVFPQLAPISFDASTLEIWGALLHGGTLAVLPPHTPTLDELGAEIERLGITSLFLTTGLFHALVEERAGALRGVRQLLAGGDVMSAPHMRKALGELPGTRLIHCYGPTENTTFTTCHTVREPIGAAVPIGRPIAGTRVYVLDAAMRPVPPGVPGELFAGGDGLARAYLHRPELTAERFVPDPVSGLPGERLYRTGDLARFLPTGDVDFLGRIDQQVKIRGFRVEPGEVESVLAAHPSVTGAAVVVRSRGGERSLMACLVAPAGSEAALRAALRERLPDYMIPADWVFLDALPLNPNGKVDRPALARIDPRIEPLREGAYEAPRNATEEKLAAIWATLLGRERVGIRDDFFEIGGHSLLGTRVMSRIRQAFGMDLPLRTLFESPTVADLAQALAGAGGAGEEIPRREAPADRFPVSFSQLRLWLLDRMDPGTPAYNIPLPLRLDGPLDRQVLERGLAEIVRRHEGLRTVFSYGDSQGGGEPSQVVVPGGEVRIPLIDLSALPEPEREEEARRAGLLELWRGFDLSRWPLLRATLVRREPGRHDFLFVVHHAVSDGWSMDVLFRELGALYEAFSAGRPSPLPELPIQYPDFAVWQRRRLQGACLGSLLDYWRGQIEDADPVLDLPTDRRRPPVLTYRGAHEIARLPPAVLESLRQREGRGRTAFMILLGAMEVLLSRWSGQDGFCVGTFIANRNRAEIETLIGLFVNTLVLRADLGALGGRPSFDRLLDQVREVTLGAYTHQDLPLERLLEALQPKRDSSRTPVFQVMLNLHNMPQPPLRFGELTMSHLPLDPRRSNFDLTFWFQPDEHGMEFDVEYSTDLFDRSTIQRLQGQLVRLLEAALAHPETPLDRLPLLAEEERTQLLVEWNRTAAETNADVPVHALFEARARRVPDKPALVSADLSLTYAELDRRSTSLARALRRRGVGPETVVGVSLRRSPGMIVALLAVLKAGGAYLALDPDYPRERLDFMIRDAGVDLVVDPEMIGRFLAEADDGGRSDWPGPDPSNLAYVIYTSGSTGRPKGVMVTHRSLSNHTASAVAGYEIRESDRILQFASLSFDTSAEEIYPCLAAGATLVLRDDSMVTSAGQFLAAADRLGITVLNFPTAFWHEIAAGLEREGAPMPASVRIVIVGGETMLADRAESWFRLLDGQGRAVRLMNSYGPTEGTVVATRGEVEPGHLATSGEPLIGRPIHNVRVYVLDREGEPAPAGVPGELYIGGMGVARGYLGRPDLTADRFVPDRFGGEAGARLYRTGDRVRWLAGRDPGDLEFLGRVDQQVKIRGFRVEIGEVEEALRRLPGVLDAVVDVRPDASGTSRLVAWLVPEATAVPGDLRALLKERLPDYMVPSVFVPLAAIPKTPSNKIDRKALPEPEPVRLEAVAYAEPQSDLERTIGGIWQQVLGVERVGLHDNFFDLGGHSLLLVQAHGRLREALGRDLDIMVLFRRPTVSALARELSKDEERPSFTQAQEMARRQRQVNAGRKQLMEKLMQQKKGR